MKYLHSMTPPTSWNGLLLTIAVAASLNCFVGSGDAQIYTAARIWNEQLLDAVRNDTARPTVHARNLYHTSAAMFDAWAAFDEGSRQVMHHERMASPDVITARHEAISYAAYGVLRHRFVDGPGGVGRGREITALALEDQMRDLGYDPFFVSTEGNSPAALGNRIAQSVVAHGLADGANEQENYADPSGYASVNSPLTFDEPGTTLADPNRWQPLEFLGVRFGQFGEQIDEPVQKFLSPYWGQVTPFALSDADRSEQGVYLDQGPPPLLNGVGNEDFRDAVVEVIRYSSVLDPSNDTRIDISPSVRGNSPLGSYQQNGHTINPATGQPYAANIVRYSDWGRVIAEFWADGPESEAPPGHWNVMANDVSDKMVELAIPKRIGGEGPKVDDLEWDVKTYLALNGAVHDAAIAAWNHKGVYDYVRPISLIRHMGQLGQASDANLTVLKNGVPVGTYHTDGLKLEAGLIEVITPETTAAGNRHAHLAGREGEIAIKSWLGPPIFAETPDDIGGVDWILAEEWLPYQRIDFVTPPFSAYLSGHSTFSRAGAEVLTQLTGDPFFPGGLYEYEFPQGEGLEFEYGPSENLTLQWATYYDAADEAGLSRLYGGIHVPADDLPGRIVGAQIGMAAWDRATDFFAIPEPNGITMLLWGLGLFSIRRRGRTRMFPSDADRIYFE